MANLNFFPAMNFCSSDRNLEFVQALQRISMFPNIDGSARTRLCHWLVCYFLEDRGEARLHELGYAKKKASNVALHVDEVRRSRSESFSAEAAQLALLIAKDPSRLSKIRDFLKV